MMLHQLLFWGIHHTRGQSIPSRSKNNKPPPLPASASKLRFIFVAAQGPAEQPEKLSFSQKLSFYPPPDLVFLRSAV
jgi:hypothetical protein